MSDTGTPYVAAEDAGVGGGAEGTEAGVEDYAIRQDDYCAWMRRELLQEAKFLNFLRMLPVLGIFLVVVSTVMQEDKSFVEEESIRTVLGKSTVGPLLHREFAPSSAKSALNSIASMQDIWVWLEETLIPMTNSSDLPPYQMVPAVHLLAESTTAFAQTCKSFPRGSESRDAVNAWLGVGCRNASPDKNRSESLWIFPGKGMGKLHTNLQSLQDVEKVEAEVIILNAHLGLVSSVVVHLNLQSFGLVQSLVKIRTTSMDPLSNNLVMIVIVLWLAAIAWRCMATLRVWQTIDSPTPCTVLVEGASVIAALASLAFLILMQQKMTTVGDTLDTLLGKPAVSDQQAAASFFQSVHAALRSSECFHISICAYGVLLIPQLSAPGQPRLSVFVQVIAMAAVDLLHFALLVLPFFLTMAVIGTMLFGRLLADFARPGVAVMTCFRITFGWFWEPQKVSMLLDKGGTTFAIWFCMFVLIAHALMFHCLVSILMDAYSVIKAETGASITVFDQCSEMFRRHKLTKAKQRVRLNEILQGVEGAPGANDSRIVNPELLMTVVQNIQEPQAKRLIKNAKMAAEQ